MTSLSQNDDFASQLLDKNTQIARKRRDAGDEHVDDDEEEGFEEDLALDMDNPHSTSEAQSHYNTLRKHMGKRRAVQTASSSSSDGEVSIGDIEAQIDVCLKYEHSTQEELNTLTDMFVKINHIYENPPELCLLHSKIYKRLHDVGMESAMPNKNTKFKVSQVKTQIFLMEMLYRKPFMHDASEKLNADTQFYHQLFLKFDLLKANIGLHKIDVSLEDFAFKFENQTVLALLNLEFRMLISGIISTNFSGRYGDDECRLFALQSIIASLRTFVGSITNVHKTSMAKNRQITQNPISSFLGLEFTQSWDKVHSKHRILLRLLVTLHQEGYARSGDYLMAPIYTKEGHFAHAYKPLMTINDWLNENYSPLFGDMEMLKVQSSSDINHVRYYLHQVNTPYFRSIKPERELVAFSNCIFDLKHHVVYLYTDAEAMRNMTFRTCINFFDQYFDPQWLTTPPEDIRICLDKILEKQQFTREAMHDMYSMLGRGLHKIGGEDGDKMEKAVFLLGEAGTGKSTMLLIYQLLYPFEKIGILQNNTNNRFAIGYVVKDKFMTIILEGRDNFSAIGQTEFNSLVCCEPMLADIKKEHMKEIIPEGVFIFVGNKAPNYNNDKGDWGRRACVFRFEVRLSETETDTSLRSQIQQEIGKILAKLNGSYRNFRAKVNNSNVHLHFSQQVKNWTRYTMEVSNPLIEFIEFTDNVTKSKNFVYPLNKFLQKYNEYVQTHKLKQINLNPEFLKSVFKNLQLEVVSAKTVFDQEVENQQQAQAQAQTATAPEIGAKRGPRDGNAARTNTKRAKNPDLKVVYEQTPAKPNVATTVNSYIRGLTINSDSLYYTEQPMSDEDYKALFSTTSYAAPKSIDLTATTAKEIDADAAIAFKITVPQNLSTPKPTTPAQTPEQPEQQQKQPLPAPTQQQQQTSQVLVSQDDDDSWATSGTLKQ